LKIASDDELDDGIDYSFEKELEPKSAREKELD
jgi:hypothetical protein